MERKPIIVLLAGPTASGKSKIAIKLSKVLNGEIVNADSMQVYKELKILTSRPSPNFNDYVFTHFCQCNNFWQPKSKTLYRD